MSASFSFGIASILKEASPGGQRGSPGQAFPGRINPAASGALDRGTVFDPLPACLRLREESGAPHQGPGNHTCPSSINGRKAQSKQAGNGERQLRLIADVRAPKELEPSSPGNAAHSKAMSLMGHRTVSACRICQDSIAEACLEVYNEFSHGNARALPRGSGDGPINTNMIHGNIEVRKD